MNIWLIIGGMALVTYIPRVLPLLTLNEDMLPPLVRRALGYVPLAVLSAIIAPAYIPSEDWFQFTLDGHLVAGIGAIIAARVTKNTFATIAVGMAILIVLS